MILRFQRITSRNLLFADQLGRGKEMIKNFLDTDCQIQMNSHAGKGPVKLYEIWEKSDFQSKCDFIDRVVIPPGSEVGYHKHGNNEEIYIVLSGTSTMILDGHPHIIKKGDMILNSAFGEHGLINNSDA